jgi:uncharacterized protein (DUF433 family)
MSLPVEGDEPSMSIVRDPEHSDGVPTIEATGIRVKDVAVAYEHSEDDPNEIAQPYPDLSLADVHRALAYHYDTVGEFGSADAVEDEVVVLQRKHLDSGRRLTASSCTSFGEFVAEIMLQQTSVQQVLGVYREFVGRYPAPTAIADIAEDDLAEEIRPFGSSKRGEYFRRVCEQMLEEHDDRVPTKSSDLLE